MARARNIKPAIMDNEELADLEPLTRLLFIYLWMLADREGRLEDRPKRIAAQALPYDRATDVGAMLDELHKAGFIERYEANGVACIQITNFAKHQSPHVRETASELPSPESGTTKASTRHNLGNAETSPGSPDSGFLIPDSGLLIADTATSDKPPSASAAPTPVRKKSRLAKIPLPANFGASERVMAWATSKGFGQIDEHLDAFKRKASANGYAYVDWDSAFMEAIREDWAKLRGKTANGAAPSSGPKRGSDEYAALHKSATWWRDAGFDTVYDAIANHCWHNNAAQFHDGKRTEVAA